MAPSRCKQSRHFICPALPPLLFKLRTTAGACAMVAEVWLGWSCITARCSAAAWTLAAPRFPSRLPCLLELSKQVLFLATKNQGSPQQNKGAGVLDTPRPRLRVYETSQVVKLNCEPQGCSRKASFLLSYFFWPALDVGTLGRWDAGNAA